MKMIREWVLCIYLLAHLALTAISPASAQVSTTTLRPPDTAEVFAQTVVKLYDPGSPLWRPNNARAQAEYADGLFANLYDPQFAKLIKDNRRLASLRWQGEDLDHDPVCECQGPVGPIHILAVSRRSGQFADVKLRKGCDAPGDCLDYTMVIRRIGGVWKLYDIVDSQGSTRDWLGRHNLCLRSARQGLDLDKCMR